MPVGTRSSRAAPPGAAERHGLPTRLHTSAPRILQALAQVPSVEPAADDALANGDSAELQASLARQSGQQVARADDPLVRRDGDEPQGRAADASSTVTSGCSAAKLWSASSVSTTTGWASAVRATPSGSAGSGL